MHKSTSRYRKADDLLFYCLLVVKHLHHFVTINSAECCCNACLSTSWLSHWLIGSCYLWKHLIWQSSVWPELFHCSGEKLRPGLLPWPTSLQSDPQPTPPFLTWNTSVTSSPRPSHLHASTASASPTLIISIPSLHPDWSNTLQLVPAVSAPSPQHLSYYHYHHLISTVSSDSGSASSMKLKWEPWTEKSIKILKSIKISWEWLYPSAIFVHSICFRSFATLLY